VEGYGKAVKGREETPEKTEWEKCGRERKNVPFSTMAR